MTNNYLDAHGPVMCKSFAALRMTIALCALLVASPSADAGAQRVASKADDARWSAIRKVFGQDGKTEDGYLRLEFPRSDIRVKIGNDALEPDFEFIAYFGFVPVGATNVMVMGELVLKEEEVTPVFREAATQGIHIAALHNHLLGESPRLVYTHFTVERAPAAVANKLHALIGKTSIPLSPHAEEKSTVDWTSIDRVLGKHEEATGTVAAYGFKRRDKLTVGGHAVKSSGALETASEVTFQQLSAGRVAMTGELYLLPSEVRPVVAALTEHGLHVTALHMHMIDDGPAHYWVHWYTTGDGPTLARAFTAVLSHTNSEQKSGGKE